jgi:hypothetical protein
MPTKKNGYKPPICKDERLRYVTAACGKCYECRKQKGRAWQVRLGEEVRNDPNVIFVTLTISDESWEKLRKKYSYSSEDDYIKKMVRLFLERIRKKTKKSVKHWLTTERGEQNTERYHLHGLIWGDKNGILTTLHWQYGFVYIGEFVNEKTCNYVTKYITKRDEKHKDFVPITLCSAGIGEGYLKRSDSELNRYRENKTNETYRLRNGVKINLPIYYRNKIYSEEEREKLFIEKIEKGKVWICGIECDISDEAAYTQILQEQQLEKQKIHGDDPKQWEVAKYLKRLARQRK